MRTWAEIDLDNLSHNIQTLKKYAGNKAIMGVVKAIEKSEIATAIGMGDFPFNVRGISR